MKTLLKNQKFPLIATVALAAFFLVLLNKQTQKITAMKELRRSLQIEQEEVRARERQHRSLHTTAQQISDTPNQGLVTLTGGLVSFFCSARDHHSHWDTPDPDAKQQRETALLLMRQFQALSPDDMKKAFATMISDQNLGANEQVYVARELFKLMADHSPELGLNIFLDHRTTWSSYVNQSIYTPLVRALAKTNPAAAIQWLENNKEELKKIDHFAKRDLVAEIGKKDFAHALVVSKQLQVSARSIASILGKQTRTTEQRIALLLAIEESEAHGLPSIHTRKAAIESIARNVRQDDFDATLALFESAQFTESEKDIVISQLYSLPTGLASFLDSHTMPGKDTQKWIEWLDQNYTNARGKKISHLVKKWSEYSPSEVDQWISRQDDGPLKSIAMEAITQP